MRYIKKNIELFKHYQSTNHFIFHELIKQNQKHLHYKLNYSIIRKATYHKNKNTFLP